MEVLKDSIGRQANEKYNLYRVSSTRQLCVEKPKIKYTNATLYGGLIYEMDSTQMIAQSRTYHSAEDYVASRGFVADSSMREGWSYLPATKSEVEMIARQMYEHGIRPERYTERNRFGRIVSLPDRAGGDYQRGCIWIATSFQKSRRTNFDYEFVARR